MGLEGLKHDLVLDYYLQVPSMSSILKLADLALAFIYKHLEFCKLDSEHLLDNFQFSD